MERFTRVEGVAAPLLRDHVDTDAIIPVSHMKTMADDFGKSLFANWRYQPDGLENPEFVLNRPAYRRARILVAARNFGCGSSREHAVWALLGFGIRCVIAESFGDIFYHNSFRNGLLPVVLGAEETKSLGREVTDAVGRCPTVVDLERREIVGPGGRRYEFSVEPTKRRILLEGLDAIGITLLRAAEIGEFQRRDLQRRPWIHSIDPRASPRRGPAD